MISVHNQSYTQEADESREVTEDFAIYENRYNEIGMLASTIA